MSIRADIQKLDPGAIVQFFVLDATNIGGEILRFHPGVNELGNDVVWQGNTYLRFPIEADGFEWSGQGTLPRPRVRVANVTGILGAAVKANDDLVGAKVTRKRTFVRYLDPVNFAAGNPYSDPNAHFRDEVYVIDRKSAENKLLIEWELAAAIDLGGVMLPRRQIIQNVCTWRYRHAECGYTGGPVADVTDKPTLDPTKDECGRRLVSCKLRFGEYAVLPYGGFPAAGLLR